MSSSRLPILTLGLGLLFAAPAFAQTTTTTQVRRQVTHSPAAAEVTAYYRDNLLPVLRQQRQKLETQLSAADQTALAGYRTQLRELGKRRRALRPAPTPDATAARPTLTEAQQQQLRELRQETQAVRQHVSELATKYKDNIARLSQEVQPQQEKWEADVKAIAEKNLSPEQKARIAAGHRLRHHGLRHTFEPTRFLLMNPVATSGAGVDMEDLVDEVMADPGVYPNPASSTSQLAYQLKKAGPVTIKLLDSKGQELRTLLQSTPQEAGAHTQALDLGDLPAGTYYYKITSAGGTETKRFVRE